MSQRYSIIPYKEYLLSFLHYYYIIRYLYYYRMSSNTGPQLRLTAPLCLPLWRHMAQKHPWTAFITTDMTKSERKARLVGLFHGWGNEGKLKKKKVPGILRMISHEIASLYCPQAGLCGFHGHLYNAHGCFWSSGRSTQAGLQPHGRPQHTHAVLSRHGAPVHGTSLKTGKRTHPSLLHLHTYSVKSKGKSNTYH